MGASCHPQDSIPHSRGDGRLPSDEGLAVAGQSDGPPPRGPGTGSALTPCPTRRRCARHPARSCQDPIDVLTSTPRCSSYTDVSRPHVVPRG